MMQEGCLRLNVPVQRDHGKMSLRKLLALRGGAVSLMDMCQYGMTAEDKNAVAPVRKTTKIASNSPEIADALSANSASRYFCRHAHASLLKRRCRKSPGEDELLQTRGKFHSAAKR